MNIEDMTLYSNIKKQKLSYAGHLLRGSAGKTVLQILEGIALTTYHHHYDLISVV